VRSSPTVYGPVRSAAGRTLAAGEQFSNFLSSLGSQKEHKPSFVSPNAVDDGVTDRVIQRRAQVRERRIRRIRCDEHDADRSAICFCCRDGLDIDLIIPAHHAGNCAAGDGFGIDTKYRPHEDVILISHDVRDGFDIGH